MATAQSRRPAKNEAAPPEDLDALFDQISAERDAKETCAPAPAPLKAETSAMAEDPKDVFQRVGHLTRTLHDALRELGYDKAVESAVGTLPDARARLSYIAKLTGEAAHRVLSAAEQGQSLHGEIDAQARPLTARWEKLYANELSVEEFKALAADSRDFIASMQDRGRVGRELFSEIMMAQDFHDLTGQVIQRIVGIAQTLEDQLVKLLVEAVPPDRRAATEGFLTGPAVDTKGRDDIVTNQAQVDDLLESLGF